MNDAAAAASAVAEVEALGRRAVGVQGDTVDSGAIRSVVAATLAALGRIDILVNNAGILSRVPFLELTEAEWDRVVDVNMKGYFLVG